MRQPLIVGVGGTLRDGSTSERALKVALGAAVEMGCATKLFGGNAINLPPYDPAERQRSVEAKALVDALCAADGLILASPGYHGTISGLLKNALDYTEDLRGDARRLSVGPRGRNHRLRRRHPGHGHDPFDPPLDRTRASRLADAVCSRRQFRRPAF